jgi:hypothetical protein
MKLTAEAMIEFDGYAQLAATLPAGGPAKIARCEGCGASLGAVVNGAGVAIGSFTAKVEFHGEAASIRTQLVSSSRLSRSVTIDCGCCGHPNRIPVAEKKRS